MLISPRLNDGSPRKAEFETRIIVFDIDAEPTGTAWYKTKRVWHTSFATHGEETCLQAESNDLEHLHYRLYANRNNILQ